MAAVHRSILALLALAATSSALAAETQRNVVLTLGKPSGEEVIERDGNRTSVRYSFNDRGRGPEQSSHWRVDANGIPVEFAVDGKSYMKTPVEERYSRDASGKATWRNEDEQGERANAGNAFYIAAASPPAVDEVLVAALLLAPGQKLALLPAGEASLEKVRELEVADKAGKRIKVMLYEINGLGYTPWPAWIDSEGHSFASVSEWFSVVREGYEERIPELLEVQSARERGRGAELARWLARKPDGALLVHNARVFDPRDGSVTPATDVLVEGNRISAMGKGGSFAVPAKVEELDAADRFLMPGLWDNHVHLGDVDGLLHLAAGVTSVRDMANDEERTPDRVARMDRGEELGPRVLMAGFMDGRGEFAGPTRVFVDTPEEAGKWVNWYADHGYVQIKVYSSLKPELVPVIARLAHARGLRLSGHVPAFMTAEQFIEAGADEIQHLNFLFLNFLVKESPDTRNMTRFHAVGANAVNFSPDGERERAFIDLLRRHHTSYDITVNIFEDMFDGAPGKIIPGYAGIVPRLPPQIARGLRGGNVEAPKGQEKAYAGAFAAMLRFVPALHAAGIPIVPGTDSPPGFGLHRELELWVRAGVSPSDTLRAATLGSAEVNRRAADLGVVAPGKFADFILVDGDPLKNISDIRRVRTVVKDGAVHDAAALYAAVGVKPAP
jgi:hypothetical protein